MAIICINTITIYGESQELKKLYHKLEPETGYIDFEKVLDMTYKDKIGDGVVEFAGTTWFMPNIKLYKDSMTLIGQSACYPPLAFLEKLIPKYPSLKIELEFEKPGDDSRGKIEISNKGTHVIFDGGYLEYLAKFNYPGFLVVIKHEISTEIHYQNIVTVEEIKNMQQIKDLIKSEDDWEKLFLEITEISSKGFFGFQFSEGSEFFDRFFVDPDNETFKERMIENPNLILTKLG